MNSVSRVINSIKLCFWNIGGVKNKFMSEITHDVIQDNDVLVICETHFNVRSKCPDNFFLVEKSPPTESKRPRGGVAIYKKIHCSLQFTTLLNIPDCTVCEIQDTNIILVALYIPPNNSKYFSEDLFDHLKAIFAHFLPQKSIYVVGDLNSRYGDLNDISTLHYNINPDSTINQNGTKLRKILQEFPSIKLLNGLNHQMKPYDSNYTFFRGKSATQIDVCLTNNVDNTEKLNILQKTAISDHSPVTITISVKRDLPLDLIDDCALYFLSEKHYDINRKLRRSVRFEDCNLVNLVSDLDLLGRNLQEETDALETKEQVEELNKKITDGIYEACIRNRRKETLSELITHENENLQNCSSKNFQAIADANAAYYTTLAENNDPRAPQAKELWLKYQEMVFMKEKEELEQNNCKKWKFLYNNKSKKMWELADWKKKDNKEKKELSAEVTAKFFKRIFQAEKISKDPKLTEAIDDVNSYNQNCETTDKDISKEEIEEATKKMKRGVGMDGIPPRVMSVTPESLLNVITKLYNSIFGKHYPECWNEQLLLAFAKKDHSREKPSLRGIGIGPVLSRMFDVVVNSRFGRWYIPNREQAGFRPEQGCLLQILALLMLIDISRREKKDMMIGVIDYEKAFDFTNRFLLCHDLMDKKFGKRFVQNFMNSYESTRYVVKASSTERGPSIDTDQGLTQGKTTSSNYFSLFVSDMPNGLQEANNQDFMDPFNIFQLADDTTVIAEVIRSFIRNMTIVSKYSLEKFLRIHLTKSQYLHLTSDITKKLSEDIILENMTLKPIIDAYNWLGFWLSDTNDVAQIIEYHFKKKLVHISSFYSWLAINQDTPFAIKMLVLYNCLFATLLYSCEVWINLPNLSEQLLGIERKALKSCLGVKQSTTDDIIYLELNKADIVSTILDRQLNFYTKLMKHDQNSAIVIGVWNLYNNIIGNEVGFLHYFQSLEPKNKCTNKTNRVERIQLSDRSMSSRYNELCSLKYCETLYNSFVIERYRTVITRWRLSSHSLRIETGRYTRPKTPRSERNCSICNTVEDEHHALFVCNAHIFIREHYKDIISKYPTVQAILNPVTTNDANTIGKYILDIERNMDELKMIGKV